MTPVFMPIPIVSGGGGSICTIPLPVAWAIGVVASIIAIILAAICIYGIKENWGYDWVIVGLLFIGTLILLGLLALGVGLIVAQYIGC